MPAGSTKGTVSTPKSNRPSKSSQEKSTKESHKCAVCSIVIVDGKDEGLFCEGSCQAWLHRRCAGVTVHHFRHLSDSDEKFFCIFCSGLELRSSLSKLESEVAALKVENIRLQASVESLRSEINDVKSHKAASSYASHVNKKSPRVTKKSEQETHKPRDSHGVKSKVPVDNARKIWGTLKGTVTSSVTNAIKRLITNLDSLSIKRKFVAQAGITKKWWFVVRGNKADIDRLESDWDKVEIQTGWKLQPLFSFAAGTEQSQLNSIPHSLATATTTTSATLAPISARSDTEASSSPRPISSPVPSSLPPNLDSVPLVPASTALNSSSTPAVPVPVGNPRPADGCAESNSFLPNVRTTLLPT